VIEEPPFKMPKWAWVVGAIVLLAGAVYLPGWVKGQFAIKGAVRTHTALIIAANRQDLETIQHLCTKGYVNSHKIVVAKEGGVIGLPRNINKNFQAWAEGDLAYLCPSNRVGPVYRYTWEDSDWKFDGPAGVLRSGGQFVKSTVDEAGEEAGIDLP
jgi:hypothetical protein